jgi:hypothetical protein
MILGDSLQVMASLAEREALRGKVQCIYFDPPYGIKFNSNFRGRRVTKPDPGPMRLKKLAENPSRLRLSETHGATGSIAISRT